MADLKKLAEELVNLTVKDVKELADILKEEYGIEPAAAAVAVAAAAATLAPVLFCFATLFWFENDGLFIEKPMIKTP